jgi:TRAP-type C4-dicarboxylate transport system permease small subunit
VTIPRSDPRTNQHRLVDRVLPVTHWIGEAVGYVSSAVLVALTLSIVLGIAMRTMDIDNSWTYDVDLFTLIWVAFVGAAFTAVRGQHVTSGLSPEMIFKNSKNLFVWIRFAIMAVFLLLFTASGFMQFMNSVQTHETTLDVMSWPVWIAVIAVPLGTLLWLVAEIHVLLRQLAARNN